jgi:peptidylprolyl isomerase
MGDIVVELFPNHAPKTVRNFVELATGAKEWSHPVTGKTSSDNLYDGTVFHRVISGFMIQGGDPIGNGTGGPGYKFADEFHPELVFDRPYLLAMANSGPGTNSSQFFITHKETPWLNGLHTIFGHVVENGMKTVNTIVQNDDIKSITIIRKGVAAMKFDAAKVFNDYFAKEKENIKKQALIEDQTKKFYLEKYKPAIDAKIAFFNKLRETCSTSRSGLQFVIVKKGTGKKPTLGTDIFINYAGFLEDGTLFDTSYQNVATEFGKLDKQRADANQYLPIPFQAGKKEGMIPGFIEGIENLSFGDKAILFIPSHLGYGEAGAGGVIPPNANIIFEIELLENMPK